MLADWGMQVRTGMVLGLMVCLWVGLIFRIYVLQFEKAGFLVEKADRQHEGILKVAPRRGQILDRNGNLFAVSVKVKSVFCVPGEVQEVWKQARFLAGILGVSRNELVKKLTRPNTQFCWLKRKIGDEEAHFLEQKKIPGIYMIDEMKRFYPKGSRLSHVIGFVNIDNEGLAGIEGAMNLPLKGKMGLARIVRDAKGQEIVVRRDFIEQPQDGQDLMLTVDEVAQNIVEEEQDITWKEWSPQGITTVVMQVKTGEILALSNRPTFDLNHPGKAEKEAFKNRVILEAYEPGSVFKVISGTAVLNEGLSWLSEVIDCEGGAYRVAGHTLHDSSPHDGLTFKMVLAKSSNIGVSKVASRLSPEQLYRYVKAYGFGKATGLPLWGESAGCVWHTKKWSGYSTTAIAMGHEVMVTPIQMACAITTVANRGVKVNPLLLKEMRDQEGHVLETFHVVEGETVMRPETADHLIEALQAAVSDEGTAPMARVPGYSVAGKTGTAQKVKDGHYSHSKYVSSFVGFIPASNPILSITVMVDEPSRRAYGGTVAAPLFSRIAGRLMAYLKVPPDQSLELQEKSMLGKKEV
jgi:cell division protein FtsI (penicillin-binding protein 3)